MIWLCSDKTASQVLLCLARLCADRSCGFPSFTAEAVEKYHYLFDILPTCRPSLETSICPVVASTDEQLSHPQFQRSTCRDGYAAIS